VTDKPSVFPPDTHSHAPGDITNLDEAIDDRVAALLVEGSNIALTYDDEAGTLTIAAAGGGSGDVATDTIWDAKGDLAVGSAADTAARLPVGLDGHVLVADSAQALGIKWTAPSASLGGITGTFNTADSVVAVIDGLIIDIALIEDILTDPSNSALTDHTGHLLTEG
jgi:hypothetical protein